MGVMDGKIAIVTGAGQGLGYYVSKRFVDDGAKVLLIGRTPEKIFKAAEKIGSPNAIPYPMDCGVAENWVKLVSYVKENFGEIDIIVNNAAIIPGKDILNTSFDLFHEVIHCNLDSVFLGMKYGYEVLKKGVFSSIINISSVGGLKAGPATGNDAGYNATKAAVRNITKHAAYVFAKDSIRVVSVHPSGINTQMRIDYIKAHPEAEAAAALRSPLPPHCNEPEDLAGIIEFLTMPEAKAITGSEIIADCGGMAI